MFITLICNGLFLSCLKAGLYQAKVYEGQLKKGGDIINKFKHLIKTLEDNLSFILVLLALISFTVAGFLFNILIGLLVLGFCLFFLAWIISPNETGGAS